MNLKIRWLMVWESIRWSPLPFDERCRYFMRAFSLYGLFLDLQSDYRALNREGRIQWWIAWGIILTPVVMVLMALSWMWLTATIVCVFLIVLLALTFMKH